MSLVFKIILISASVLTLLFMIKRIRHAKVQIEDSIFWIIFSFMLLILSVFPQIANFMARTLGIYSTVNFIFLFIIFILLIREFTMTIKISQLETKIRNLTQEIAIHNNVEKQDNSQN